MSTKGRHRAALRAARRSPRLPGDAAAAAGRGVDLLRALRAARHRGGCAQRIAAAAAGPPTGLRLLAVSHPLCPPPAAAAAALEVADITDWQTRRAAVIKHPRCPRDLLERLAFDPDPQVRSAVAKHPRCPPTALRALAADLDTAVLEHVAANPACPPATHALLAAAENTGVRAVAATNPACSRDLLATLITDDSDYVRSAAAANPACPLDLLERFAARDPAGPLRRGAARNPNASAVLLQQLAVDPGPRAPWTVLEGVASNPNCGAAVLEVLTGTDAHTDRDDEHAEMSARIGAKIEESGSYAYDEIRSAAAANPACPPEILRKLCESSTYVETLAAVVANPNCPAEIFESFADTGSVNGVPLTGNKNSRTAAARNPACPPRVL